MICTEPLTEEQRQRSQKNYYIFSLINGLSYMCLGETVLILLAVQLECPDYVVSTLGAMMYLGFVMLPWGRVVTANRGAAKAQANFWVARNMAALLVATSAVFYAVNLRGMAVAALLAGAFFFYGFRAAGVVMSQPLVGEITTDDDRGLVLARSNGFFYMSCFAALIAVTVILGIDDGLWMLAGIVVVGAALGCTASRFLAKIDETEKIRFSAQRPIGEELRAALENPALRMQLLPGFVINAGIIMLNPISMLALKRGFEVSDRNAMIFALCQFGACAGVSFLTGHIAAAIGPRKMLLCAFAMLISLGGIWQIVPASYNPWCMGILFIIAGASFVMLNNGVTHYFLQTIDEERRVTSSMILSVFTGAGAGICGMLLSGILLELCSRWHPGDNLASYRLYFLIAMLVLLPGLWAIYRLIPLPEEKRRLNTPIMDCQIGNRMNYGHSSERVFRRAGKTAASAETRPAGDSQRLKTSKRIPITKLQGAGNDFIMLDNRTLGFNHEQKVAFVKHFCQPRISIGADGVAFLENDREYDLAWDFYNSDGSSAEMCGNGSRCFAVYATSLGAVCSPFTFRTLAGPIKAEITQPLDGYDAARARVQLTPAGRYETVEGIEAAGRKFTGYLLNTGVPHFVVILENPEEFDAFDVQTYGRALRYHERFAPAGTNVNFIKVDEKGEIWVRTYERGVEAETLACGTGSVASAIVAGEICRVAGEKRVHTRSGDLLRIAYETAESGYNQVFLEGPAVRVFKGEVTFAV